MKKIALLTAFAFLIAVTSFGQRFSKSLKDTPGMVSYTFRNEFAKDMPGTLDKIKAMGITNIEFSNLFGKTAAEIRAELDKRGMRCTSHGVGYDDLMKKLDMVAENAKTLGAKYVRLAWIPHQGKYSLEAAQKTVSEFNQIGKQLKDKGLMFVYHNHGFEFEPYEDGTLFDYIVQKTDPNYVNFEMDILWVYFPGQDPAKLLAKYPNRFKLMHLKDLKKGIQGNMSGGTPPENDVALGTGQINLPAVLKAAQKSSIEYFYIEDESPSAQQQVPQSLAYLKSI
ncbi:sugar phosphate isomerase/epimerase family protein [Larkinella sp. VNQ87]|uniref:sugar phosphate isomerase/epimerase family protein n=1 Tax=Larkinella sp. VNQ87 TaxID=3400921 RepID=UPI003BFE0162